MTSTPLTRRRLLQQGAASAALLPLATWAPAQDRRFEPQVGPWRRFEVSTTIAVADHQGSTRIWVPVPSVETDYQRTLDSAWSGNASQAGLVADAERGVRMFHAEFAPSVKAPTTGRFTSCGWASSR